MTCGLFGSGLSGSSSYEDPIVQLLPQWLENDLLSFVLVIVHWSASFRHPLPDVCNDSGYALILCHLYWAKFWESPHWCHLWAKSWNFSKIHWSIFRPFFVGKMSGCILKFLGTKELVIGTLVDPPSQLKWKRMKHELCQSCSPFCY